MFFEEGKWLFTNDDAMGSELDNIIKQSSSFVVSSLASHASSSLLRLIRIDKDLHRPTNMRQFLSL
jgi:hypothetical protein